MVSGHEILALEIDLKEFTEALENESLQLEQAIKELYITMEADLRKCQNLLEQVEEYEESFRVCEIRFNNAYYTWWSTS